MPSLIVRYVHTEADIEFALKGVRKALKVHKKALEKGVDKCL